VRGPSRALRRDCRDIIRSAGRPCARQAARDLAGDEGLAAHGRLMVEENSVAGVDAVGLAVVDDDPVAVELGDAVGRARVERGGLALRRLSH